MTPDPEKLADEIERERNAMLEIADHIQGRRPLPLSLEQFQEAGRLLRRAALRHNIPDGAREAWSTAASELEDANNACIELARDHGFATGHGDTVGDMVREFSAQILSPQAGVRESERTWIIDLIRNEYDKAPDHYRMGDNWDDGCERIADAILTRLASPSPESRNAIVEECARVADHFAMICTETTTAEKDEHARKRAAQVAEAIRALVLREGEK